MKQYNDSIQLEKGTSIKIPKSFAKNATYLIHYILVLKIKIQNIQKNSFNSCGSISRQKLTVSYALCILQVVLSTNCYKYKLLIRYQSNAP